MPRRDDGLPPDPLLEDFPPTLNENGRVPPADRKADLSWEGVVGRPPHTLYAKVLHTCPWHPTNLIGRYRSLKAMQAGDEAKTLRDVEARFLREARHRGFGTEADEVAEARVAVATGGSGLPFADLFGGALEEEAVDREGPVAVVALRAQRRQEGLARGRDGNEFPPLRTEVRGHAASELLDGAAGLPHVSIGDLLHIVRAAIDLLPPRMQDGVLPLHHANECRWNPSSSACPQGILTA